MWLVSFFCFRFTQGKLKLLHIDNGMMRKDESAEGKQRLRGWCCNSCVGLPLMCLFFLFCLFCLCFVFVFLLSCCSLLFSVQAIQERGAGHDEMWWFNVESDANGVGGQL